MSTKHKRGSKRTSRSRSGSPRKSKSKKTSRDFKKNEQIGLLNNKSGYAKTTVLGDANYNYFRNAALRSKGKKKPTDLGGSAKDVFNYLSGNGFKLERKRQQDIVAYYKKGDGFAYGRLGDDTELDAADILADPSTISLFKMVDSNVVLRADLFENGLLSKDKFKAYEKSTNLIADLKEYLDGELQGEEMREAFSLVKSKERGRRKAKRHFDKPEKELSKEEKLRFIKEVLLDNLPKDDVLRTEVYKSTVRTFTIGNIASIEFPVRGSGKTKFLMPTATERKEISEKKKAQKRAQKKAQKK